MSKISFSGPLHPILQQACERGRVPRLPFAGGVTATQAWVVFQEEGARLVDIRTHEERKFVGYVPDSLHVVWAAGVGMTRNPRFLRDLEAIASRDDAVLLLCRSGKRSAAAAEAATKAGFSRVFNIVEGFEGDLNDMQQRGTCNGWRLRGLPWVQD